MSFLNQNLMLKVLLIFGIFYVSQGGCHDIPAHREVVAGALFPWRRRRQVDLCGDAQWCVPHLPCPQVQERLRPLKVCGFCIFLYSVFLYRFTSQTYSLVSPCFTCYFSANLAIGLIYICIISHRTYIQCMGWDEMWCEYNHSRII